MALVHTPQAIAAGRCNVALITLAGRPRSEGNNGTAPPARNMPARPKPPGEAPRPDHLNGYGHGGKRHMHLYGTTSWNSWRLDQVASPARPAQPARHAARRGDGGRRDELARHRRPAAPAGLLRGHDGGARSSSRAEIAQA